MSNPNPPTRRRSDRAPRTPAKPSDAIVSLLNVLRDRIAKLLTARSQTEFDQFVSSVDDWREVEEALDEPFEFAGTRAPLCELFRTEAMLAGSLDSDARDVMDNVFDAVLAARQSAWGIREPWREFAAPWQDENRRENEKATREADKFLCLAIAEVRACAAGRADGHTLSANVEPTRLDNHGDGPVTSDCRSFRIGTDVLSLTRTQAAVVQVYWDTRKAGVVELAERTALAEAESDGKRIRDLFKKRVSGKSVVDPAFKRLFKPGQMKGTFSLNLPD